MVAGNLNSPEYNVTKSNSVSPEAVKKEVEKQIKGLIHPVRNAEMSAAASQFADPHIIATEIPRVRGVSREFGQNRASTKIEVDGVLPLRPGMSVIDGEELMQAVSQQFASMNSVLERKLGEAGGRMRDAEVRADEMVDVVKALHGQIEELKSSGKSISVLSVREAIKSKLTRPVEGMRRRDKIRLIIEVASRSGWEVAKLVAESFGFGGLTRFAEASYKALRGGDS